MNVPQQVSLRRACGVALFKAFGAALFIASLAPGRVLAEEPAPYAPTLPAQMRITYSRAPGAEACRDEAAFRAAVVRRLLRHPDPFVASAEAEVKVTLERGRTPTGQRYAGHWEIMDGAGTLVFSEEIPLGAMNVDCVPVVEGLAFKLAYWLDAAQPPSAPATAPAAPAAPGESAPSTAAPAASAPSASAEPKCPPPKGAFVPPPLPPERFTASAQVPAASPAVGSEPAVPAGQAGRMFVSASGVAGLALTPSPAGGVAIGVGWRAPWWSVAAEGQVLVSLRSTLAHGEVSVPYDFIRATDALVPCLHWRWLMGCGVLDIGVLHPDVAARAKNTTTPGDYFVLGIGGRIAAELPLGPLSVRAGVDVLGAVRAAGIRDEGYVVWRQPSVGAMPWAGLAWLL